MDLYLYVTPLDFWKAYDRVFHEALAVALESWGIRGWLDDLFLSFLKAECAVVGTGGFPNSTSFRQERGLPADMIVVLA